MFSYCLKINIESTSGNTPPDFCPFAKLSNEKITKNKNMYIIVNFFTDQFWQIKIKNKVLFVWSLTYFINTKNL